MKFRPGNKPAKSEPPKREPPKSEPPKTEPPKSEPVKSEPVKSEPVKSQPVAGIAGNGAAAGEFDSFLAALAGAVAERVQALSPKKGAQTDPVFFDESKTVVDWPELSAYVIEELR